MEEKQLDFNQPLLSVRRFSSTAASENDNKRKTDKSSTKRPPLPSYKSELKSGPVSNPGTVPFVWERSPGRPKNENKLQTRSIEGPLITPKLPPGRVLKVEQQNFDKDPKGTSLTQSRTKSNVYGSQSVASSDNKVTKHESRKEVIREKESSDSDDGDEAYVDARETLSRTESFFMNCSVSGLSGWGDQDVKSSESLSADQQARDFMMDRFLPAAKAMASETPQIQYTYRKPLVTPEQPRQLRKKASVATSRPLDQKWQKVLPYYAQDMNQEESEDESEDENYAPKVCGLFPSFCLLNPIPGLRVNDRILNSAIHGVQGKSIASSRRTAKEHARTAHYGKKSTDSQSAFAQEKNNLGVPEKSKHGIDPHGRVGSKLSACERTQFESTCESPIVEKTLYIDSLQKVKSSGSPSSEMKCPTDHIEDTFETLRKDSRIDKNPSTDSSIGDSKHMDIVDEKAALQLISSVSLDLSLLACADNSSDDMQVKKEKNHSNKIYSEKQGLTKLGYQGSNLDHDIIDISRLETVERKKIASENKVYSSKKSSDGLIQNPVPWRKLNLASDLEFNLKSQPAAKFVDQECTHVLDSNENPSNLASSKVGGGRKNDFENQFPTKLGQAVPSNASSLKLPLALPSPKAPSESWLKRTLPTVSSKNNISSRSNLAASIDAPTQASKPALLDPKWEVVVKSSNVHHGHLRFAEGLTPIPEA